jgi:hypothetical protein
MINHPQQIIALEKCDGKTKFEIVGPNEPMDLFGFKDPGGIDYLYVKLRLDGFQIFGKYQRTEKELESILIIINLN